MKLAAISPSGAKHHWRKGDAGFRGKIDVEPNILALLACRRGHQSEADGCPLEPCITADQKSVTFSIRALTRGANRLKPVQLKVI
ncbi:MAG: hypothetical protein CR217_07555 [Beijerinckiaceae bacterium]|nr:MAG: hypothetical protein CR217_07555 [Beijerinckiaceae bacterium]